MKKEPHRTYVAYVMRLVYFMGLDKIVYNRMCVVMFTFSFLIFIEQLLLNIQSLFGNVT